MIWKLIRFDCLMNWKFMLIWTTTFLVLMGREPVGGTRGDFLVIVAFMGIIIPLAMIAREDRFQARAALGALPVRRRDVLQARYLTGLLSSLGLMALIVVTQFLLYGVTPATASLVAPENLALAATAGVCFIAGILPLVTRFGFMGLMVFLVVLQLVGTLLLFVASQAAGAKGGLRGGIDAVSGAVRATRAGLGDPLFYLLLAATLALAGYGSYRLSVRIAERRDL